MSGDITTELAAELEGYETTKGGIRFPIGKPFGAALIRKLVQARRAEIARMSRTKRPAKNAGKRTST